MAESINLNVRVEYEQQREAILKTLKDAGYEHVRALDEDRKNLKDRFRSLGGDYKAALAMAFGRQDFNLIEVMFKGAMSTTSQLGAQGGLGRWAEKGGYEIGNLIGNAMGKSPASREALGRVWGELIEGGVKIYGAYEARRMIGAKMAPVVSAGQEAQTSGFFATGQSYIRRVIEVRQLTGETAQAVEGILTELSRVGIAFKGAGATATVYAIAADKVLNLAKGTTQQLEATAVKQYGEEWQTAGEVLERVTAATSYWQSVAERTRSSSAAALAANQNLLDMYKQVQVATKGTSFSMEGLTNIMLASVGTMHQFGLRPGMMASATGEFLSSIAPKATGLHETIQQGFFLRQLLGQSNDGRAMLTQANALAEQQGIDPLFSNLTLNQILSRENGASARFGGSILEGIANMRDSMPGSPEAKNSGMMYKMNAFLGTSPMVTQLAMRMADEYRKHLSKPGATPETALAETAASADVKNQINATAGFKGLNMEEVLQRMAGMGKAQLSSAESMQMAAEALTTQLGDDEYWPKMSKAITDALARKEASAGSIAAGPHAATGRTWDLDPGVPDPAQGPAMADAKPAPEYQGTDRLVSSYSMSTADGVRQIDTYVKDGASDPLLHAIAAVESGGIKNPYAALGKPLVKGRHKGARAIGKYQIMDFNVAQWTREALGRSMTPEEFRANPAAQDTVAKYKLGQYEKKYGLAGAASMWHSGSPNPTGYDATAGISTRQYATKVLKKASEFQAQKSQFAAQMDTRG